MKVGIGQDSHRFQEVKGKKECIIGGLSFSDVPGLDADSDGDVVLHSICNAITSITHVPILGGIAIDLCKNQGVKNSAVFLEKAMETLGDHKITHVAMTIEAKRPRLQKRIDAIRENVAQLMHLRTTQVGITCTSGDGLSDFARGEGLQCFCILTVEI